MNYTIFIKLNKVVFIKLLNSLFDKDFFDFDSENKLHNHSNTNIDASKQKREKESYAQLMEEIPISIDVINHNKTLKKYSGIGMKISAVMCCVTLTMMVISLIAKFVTFSLVLLFPLIVSFIGIIAFAILGKTVKKHISLSDKETEKLNRINVFEDGAYIPNYAFIDFDNSTESRIMIVIDYPSKLIKTIKNEERYDPIDDDHNSDVMACRLFYDKLDGVRLYNYFETGLQPFESTKDISRQRKFDEMLTEKQHRNIKAFSKGKFPIPQQQFEKLHNQLEEENEIIESKMQVSLNELKKSE